jgi:hypothetical protein
MKKAMSSRKRPCRICGRWFSPDPRLKDRQMTCGEEACKREWHRRKCAEWNKANSGLIKKERLAHRLKSVASGSGQTTVTEHVSPSPAPLQTTPKTQHLLPLAQEVIAAELAVMFEYLLRQLLKRAQAVMRRQVAVNTG